MKSGKTMEYSNWAPNQPSNINSINKTEDCLHIHRKENYGERLWNDASCKSSNDPGEYQSTTLSIILIITLEINLINFQVPTSSRNDVKVERKLKQSRCDTTSRKSRNAFKFEALSCHQVGIKHNNSAWTLSDYFSHLLHTKIMDFIRSSCVKQLVCLHGIRCGTSCGQPSSASYDQCQLYCASWP